MHNPPWSIVIIRIRSGFIVLFRDLFVVNDEITKTWIYLVPENPCSGHQDVFRLLRAHCYTVGQTSPAKPVLAGPVRTAVVLHANDATASAKEATQPVKLACKNAMPKTTS